MNIYIYSHGNSTTGNLTQYISHMLFPKQLAEAMEHDRDEGKKSRQIEK